jgi:hypothetical protein
MLPEDFPSGAPKNGQGCHVVEHTAKEHKPGRCQLLAQRRAFDTKNGVNETS